MVTTKWYFEAPSDFKIKLQSYKKDYIICYYPEKKSLSSKGYIEFNNETQIAEFIYHFNLELKPVLNKDDWAISPTGKILPGLSWSKPSNSKY